MNTNRTIGRFKDAPWIDQHQDILIGGAGGIGSNTAYNLARSVSAKIFIVDNDIVSEHNVGTQFFNRNNINAKKVHSVDLNVKFFDCLGTIVPIPTKIDDSCYRPISIAAFDNMAARKQLFDIWKSHDDRMLFIDGRLNATLYEVYSVIPGREYQYEETLFDDNNADDGECTFKQTSHFGMLIGSRITQIVCNFLSNLKEGMDITVIPFKVKEIGDLVHIEVS